jgi:hypothetical protein
LNTITKSAASESAISVDAPRGRGNQMNAGAAGAEASVLLFLHADAELPADALFAGQTLRPKNVRIF